MPAPKEVVDLVEKFERYIESYKSSQYNETQIRREFINPLFKTLGWDIDNEQGYAEAFKRTLASLQKLSPWLQLTWRKGLMPRRLVQCRRS